MKRKNNNLAPFAFLLVFIIICMIIVNIQGNKINELTINEFTQHLENSEITELQIITKVRSENYEVTGKLKDYKENESFILYLPKSDEFIAKIEEAKREIGRQYCENLGKPNDYYLNDQGKRIENCTASKNSYDSSLTKFTTCKDGSKCDLNSGLEDQIELAGETKYITEELINKDSTEVLYENLLSQLLRDDLESMLVSDEKMEEAFGNDYAIKISSRKCISALVLIIILL